MKLPRRQFMCLASRATAYAILAFLGIAAGAALVAIYLNQDTPGRNTLFVEIAKGLIQFVTIGIIGAFVKSLFDAHQDNQRRIEEMRARLQQRHDSLNDFRRDKIGQLVQVTNSLRKAPILIDAHRSARIYNEQMRVLLDSSLELRLVRHEIEALGEDEANIAFPRWHPDIKKRFEKMEDYFLGIQRDYRMHSKKLSELQVAAEKDRTRQSEVWDTMITIPSIADLLDEVDQKSKDTKYYKEYFVNYEYVLPLMLKASLQPEAANLI